VEALHAALRLICDAGFAVCATDIAVQMRCSQSLKIETGPGFHERLIHQIAHCKAASVIEAARA
jgi:hypothetical protein